jgi:thiosulfate reductase cytochrome b subunit
MTSKILLSSAAFVVLAGVIILLARIFVQIPAIESFITEFPGTTSLPATAPIGLPAWIGWQHFFNVFLMVLIIRSGITIRREKRPGAYWAPRRNPAAKVSLTVWWHQSVDTLWLINGLAFVVLLFVTGQWMRIVPTSWEVIPNAISAGIQYATLDWPTENGWVNYNSLQVLAYFTIVFVASPLAAITGYRMSGMWPERAKRLSALFRMEWARAIHFPVMIFFCGFIVIHVFLVMTTGALKNLNHMYAARDVVDWVGFWVFAGSLAIIGLAWFAVRPLVLAPIARLFGSVTSR